MLELSDLSNSHDPAIVANILGGVIGFVLVFVVLACACWLRKSASGTTESGDGYQDIRETDRRVRPFKKNRKAIANGAVHSSHSNSLQVDGNTSGSQGRIFQFPAAPLPILPPSSTPSISVIGGLTRESSTSELYASVDRNPGIVGKELRRQSSESREDGGNENTEEHTYSKIRPPPGTYDEIDDVRATSQKPPGRLRGPKQNGDVDPFYSPVNDFRLGKPGATIPPPVPRLPLKRASHPYDYPKFLSQNGRESWQGMDASDASISRKAPGFLDGDTTPGANGDAVYSKIESQYGGSEDPYSSIKGSEEHYSCIFPNRVSNGSSGDENSSAKASSSTSAKPLALHGRTGTVPAYGSIRPRAIRFVQPRRSRSDGEEYSIIRKPMSHKPGQNGAVDHVRRAPPIPEKRFFNDHSWRRTTGQYESISSSPTTAGHERLANADNPGSSFEPSYAPQEPQPDGANLAAKREPSYRFITVRESLDALRARMEAAATVIAPTTPTAPVASAQSESSLHYYATISEHSYEVVPSRRGSERNAQQRGDPNFACRSVSYIDDDEYELGAEDGVGLLATSDLSPTSNTFDENNTSSNALMNVSIHSQTGSHATSTGSHVTLVHVGGSQNNNNSSQMMQESESGTAQVHLRRGHPRTPLDSERRKARVCQMATTDDSTGAAVGIDIESRFRLDDNLSTVDQRDFNASTAGDIHGDDFDTRRRGLYRTTSRGPNVESKSPGGKSPEIVALETLENFNVSSSNSLNEEDVQARAKESGTISYQL